MIRVLMLCLILLWSGLAGADAIRVESVVSVHDGDTFSADIAGWPAIVGRRIGVRVAGIDAPELHGECPCEVALAKDARAFVTYMLQNADTIELRNVRRDKYFRLLAEVWVDGESLGESLIDAGYARPYAGGKKQGWCQ